MYGDDWFESRSIVTLALSRFFWMCFFFKQKTAYEMHISDWSSDVCSSDLYQRRTRDRAQGDRLDAQAARAGRLSAHQRQDVGRTLSGRAGTAIQDRRAHLRLWPRPVGTLPDPRLGYAQEHVGDRKEAGQRKRVEGSVDSEGGGIQIKKKR